MTGAYAGLGVGGESGDIRCAALPAAVTEQHSMPPGAGSQPPLGAHLVTRLSPAQVLTYARSRTPI